MKKAIILFLVTILFYPLSSKTVKFEVDMGTHTISPNGIHLSGDFQAMIGLGPDWDPGTLPMAQVGSSTIYRVYVNLPAFRKYEYRYVNGDQTYEVEFVPEESRVGYDFVDNRWLLVDSLSSDTMQIGAILFGGNAPAGKFLVRYKVDLSDAQSISPNGVYIGTTYQTVAFDPGKIKLYSFVPYHYEIINYVNNMLPSPFTVQYTFYNGTTVSTEETVPASCTPMGKRGVQVVKDTVLPLVCFSRCTTCLTIGLNELVNQTNQLQILPNPASEKITVRSDSESPARIRIIDCLGKEIIVQDTYQKETNIDISRFNQGIYFVRLETENSIKQTAKLIINF